MNVKRSLIIAALLLAGTAGQGFAFNAIPVPVPVPIVQPVAVSPVPFFLEASGGGIMEDIGIDRIIKMAPGDIIHTVEAYLMA